MVYGMFTFLFRYSRKQISAKNSGTQHVYITDKNFLMEHSDFCFVFKPIEHSESISFFTVYTNLADSYFPGYKSCERNAYIRVCTYTEGFRSRSRPEPGSTLNI